MKRILTVLALLAVCGMAFSVTGKVYVRYLGASPTFQNGDSGIDLNFDSFSFTYKLKIADTSDALTYLAAGATATGPGYFDLGFKASDAMAINLALTWWTKGITSTGFGTNTGGTTNSDFNATTSFNKVTIEPKIVYTVSDKITVKADRFGFTFYGGTYVKNDPKSHATNNNAVGGYSVGLPVDLAITMDGGIELEFKVKPVMSGDTWSSYAGAVTNNSTKSSVGVAEGDTFAQIKFLVAENTKLAARVGFGYTASTETAIDANPAGTSYIWNGTTLAMGANVTNTKVTTAITMPIMGRVEYTGIPKLTLKGGLGYKIQIQNTLNQVVASGTASYTNVVTTSAPGLISHWDPFVEYGGSFDVTDNFYVTVLGQMKYAPNYTDSASVVNSGAGTIRTTDAEAIAFTTGDIKLELGYKF